MDKADVKLSILAEIEASHLFADENVNWRFCTETKTGNDGMPYYCNVTFVHEHACEFIFHIGEPDEDRIFKDTIKRMRAYGCTEDFITAYVAAKEAGAVRVCFYA